MVDVIHALNVAQFNLVLALHILLIFSEARSTRKLLKSDPSRCLLMAPYLEDHPSR